MPHVCFSLEGHLSDIYHLEWSLRLYTFRDRTFFVNCRISTTADEFLRIFDCSFQASGEEQREGELTHRKVELTHRDSGVERYSLAHSHLQRCFSPLTVLLQDAPDKKSAMKKVILQSCQAGCRRGRGKHQSLFLE